MSLELVMVQLVVLVPHVDYMCTGATSGATTCGLHVYWCS